jgi:site-specific DNA-methyltransferase (adenine-specific)/modification methylase
MIQLNKIYNEDCIKTMSKMSNNFVDYSLTSPPYNVGKNQLNGEGKKYISINDKLSESEYFNSQKKLINELLRVTKNHIFYNIQMLSANKITIMKLMGFFHHKIKEIIIWNKKHGVPAMEPGVFNSAYEYIIIFSNDQPHKRKFYDVTFKGNEPNVFVIKNTHSNPFSKVHKAIMPLDIPRYLMQLFGKDNDIWYDPYMGTGTTAVACIEENKKYLGSEIYKEYCNLSSERLEPYLNQIKLF